VYKITLRSTKLLVAVIICMCIISVATSLRVPYYVRPDLYFTKQPQSYVGFPNTAMMLSCAINAQTLVSGYEFEMYWTFNGNKINSTDTGSQSGHLQLRVVLNETTAGRYQCVVQDGLFTIVSKVAEFSSFGKNDSQHL